jgi:hypothetical protein
MGSFRQAGGHPFARLLFFATGRSRRKETRIRRVPSLFIVRKNRSISEMLPCLPAAP